MIYNFVESCRASIEQEAAEKSAKLASGTWGTEAEARKLCGEIAGLRQAYDLIKVEHEKIETLSDEEMED